jgi:hypothetical protein
METMTAQKDAAKLIAELRGEDLPDDRTAAALARNGMLCADDLIQVARLGIHGSSRDVAMYVHRLAAKYQGTDTGRALAAIDTVPPVSLRDATPPAAPLDVLAPLRLLRDYLNGAFPVDELGEPFQIGAFIDCLDDIVDGPVTPPEPDDG